MPLLPLPLPKPKPPRLQSWKHRLPKQAALKAASAEAALKGDG